MQNRKHPFFRGLVGGLLLVFFALSLAEAQEEPAGSPYARRIVQESGKTFYVVGPRAPHLYMISRDLYGVDTRWREIARWNGLQAPYRLELGQKLVIPAEGIQSEAQGNQILIHEWQGRGEMERARGIAALGLPAEVVMAQAQSEAMSEVQVEVPSTTTAPAAKASFLPHAPQAPRAEPAPAARSGHGHVSIKLLGSMTDVMNEDQSHDIRNNLRTAVDPGAEIEGEWFFSEHWFLTASAAYETFEVHAGHEFHVEPESLGLSRYSLGLGSEVAPWLEVSLSGALEELAFSEPTAEGVEMEKVQIPELVLGSRWLLKDGAGTKVHGLLNLLSLFPVKAFETDLDAGFGVLAGFQISHPFSRGSLIYGLSGRMSEQKGENFKAQHTNGTFFVGWRW